MTTADPTSHENAAASGSPAPASPPATARLGWRSRLSVPEYVEGLRRKDRSVLARAITLVESRRPDDVKLAQQLITEILPSTGHSRRIGITGVPGVGKSTFIEALGMLLIEKGFRVAVLAIDPSSAVSGGSILGDKTRMVQLSNHPNAYIRPSPSSLSLGGVARRTRETLLLCEAAGFDVILVETVGVGQSETMVAGMVDFFLALMLPGAGDELQGIKKGLLELADAIVVNKADGDNLIKARSARSEYAAALRYLKPRRQEWKPEAMMVSALTGEGLADLWERIEAHRHALESSGALTGLRREQLSGWMWDLILDQLQHQFRQHPQVQALLPTVERELRAGLRSPTAAALDLLHAFGLSTDQS